MLEWWELRAINIRVSGFDNGLIQHGADGLCSYLSCEVLGGRIMFQLFLKNTRRASVIVFELAAT